MIINEICEFFPTLSNTIENFKKALPATDFYTIKKEIMTKDKNGNFANIYPVKCEMDDE
ncbi:MAG: hypothetical protein ACTTJC_02955 [Campylobacter sp.]